MIVHYNLNGRFEALIKCECNLFNFVNGEISVVLIVLQTQHFLGIYLTLVWSYVPVHLSQWLDAIPSVEAMQRRLSLLSSEARGFPRRPSHLLYPGTEAHYCCAAFSKALSQKSVCAGSGVEMGCREDFSVHSGMNPGISR